MADRMSVADVALLADLVLALWADANAMYLGWREHPRVLFAHDRLAVLTTWHTIDLSIQI